MAAMKKSTVCCLPKKEGDAEEKNGRIGIPPSRNIESLPMSHYSIVDGPVSSDSLSM